jgi:hypothetical protein
MGFSHLVWQPGKALDTTNICSYNVVVKMGVGGISPDEIAVARKFLAETYELVSQFEGQGLGAIVDREVTLIRRGCRRLELRMWRTSTLFCKTR